jgi:Fic family protein
MGTLLELFGDSPQVKIIETFAENYNKNLYIADIIRITGLSKMTVRKYIFKLLKEGIIEKSGKVGIVQFYKLNLENEKVNVILRLETNVEWCI